MALEFDGFEAWRSIADNPETFASMRAEAAKSARSALTKYIKAKAVGVLRCAASARRSEKSCSLCSSTA